MKVAEEASAGGEDGKKDVKYEGLYFAEFQEIEKYVGDRSFRWVVQLWDTYLVLSRLRIVPPRPQIRPPRHSNPLDSRPRHRRLSS